MRTKRKATPQQSRISFMNRAAKILKVAKDMAECESATIEVIPYSGWRAEVRITLLDIHGDLDATSSDSDEAC